MKKKIKIAVVGLGQVGIYLLNELNIKKNDIEIKTGKKISIEAISAKNINKKRRFKINKELIPNAITRQHLESDSKIEYIFKIILGSFKKKKKKAIGIFEEKTVVVFNKYIDDISKFIDTCLKIEQQRTATKKGLVDFGEYFDINYDTDGEGNVYPDIYDEFEKGKLSNKSKKKKGDKIK